MKIEVSNPGALDPTPLSYEFEVTIIDFCRDSELASGGKQDDVDYVIDAIPSTAGMNVPFVSVTTTTDSTRCPITISLQIFDGIGWNDYTGNEANYPWISSGSMSSTEFIIQTDDAATYADPSNS